MSNNQINIFLSYQWKSQTKVKKLFYELSNYKSFNVFMDIFKIKAGMNLYSQLASNLQQADIILACISRDYVKSKNCEREIIYSDNFNKPIIPVYIEKIPIDELGGIGFVLIRERYCSMYRNESLFENLKNSNEMNDLLDGILTQSIKLKLNVSKDLKEVECDQSIILDESNIDQAVIKFRNDSPIEEQISINQSMSKNEKIKASQPKTIETSNKNFVNFNCLEMHPIIKELGFLLKPKVLLDPVGDRFNFEQNDKDLRGGEQYFKPIGWIRYGINIKLVHPDINNWLSKDGNKNEWAVAYYGFKQMPLKSSILYQRLFDKTNKFNPTFIPSKNLEYANQKNVNKKSDTFDQTIGLGIICSPRPDLTEKHTVAFMHNKLKYKMLFQCRVNPVKIKIPSNNKEIFIISSSLDIRPYGILIKQI